MTMGGGGVPLLAWRVRPQPKGRPMSFEAYHDVTAQQHQDNVDRLTAAGFRPVVLDVSGDPGDARYAAVWVDDPGPGWRALHGLDAATYQARFTELTGEGWAPVVVSATGPRDRAVFAALFEGDHPEERFAHHDLVWNEAGPHGSLQEAMTRAHRDGFVPVSLTAYGDPDDERYAGVWASDPAAVAWSLQRASLDDWQRRFVAALDAGLRPGCLTLTAGGDVLAVVRDDQVGTWTACHGVSAAEYQQHFDSALGQGLRPIAVSASPSDAGRYAAVFAATDRPVDRVATVTGDDLPGSAELDAAVLGAMRDQGIRALSVAFARGGGLLGRRAYTWAEPDYPVTRPQTRFRIASVSKAFAAAVVAELVAGQQLSWTTAALPYVGVTSTLPLGTPAHTQFDGVTVQQLVLQTSGFPRDLDRDQRGIAAALSWPVAPLSRDLVLKYFYGAPLGPVEADGYSNPAFYLLTEVVSHCTGMSFLDAARQWVLDPLGIADVTVADTGPGQRQPGEVATYDDPEVGPAQLDYSDGAVAAKAYGGDFVLENCPGAGGLVTSAASMARLVGHYPVWNAPSTLTGRMVATRYGSLPGTSAGAVCRADGLDFAFVFNRASSAAWKDALRDRLHAYLDAHGSELVPPHVDDRVDDGISGGIRGGILGSVPGQGRPGVSDHVGGAGPRIGGLLPPP